MTRLARIFFIATLIASLTIGYSNPIAAEPISPAAPQTKAIMLCAPSSVSLVANGSTGIYRWYYTSSGGNYILNPGAVFVSHTTTFYVSAIQFNGGRWVESVRVPLNISVNLISPPKVDTVSLCQASFQYLNSSGAQANQVYHWYTDKESSTAIRISENENDKSIYEYVDSSSTYYTSIVSLTTGCESARIKVPVYFKPSPTDPVVLKAPTICGSGIITFEVQDEQDYTFFWYPCQTSCGYHVNRGGSGATYHENTFDTYLYNYSTISTYTIWVEKISNTTSCVSRRIPITATSFKVSPPQITQQVYKCRKDIDTIVANTEFSTGRIYWYGDIEKQQLLAAGNTFAIPSDIQTPTSVYAVVKDSTMNQCESEAWEGAVVIYPDALPPAPIVMTNKNCGEVIFDVVQTVHNGNYLWFTHDTIQAVHSGPRLVNSANSEYASEVFYVCLETMEGCRGNKTKVEGHPLEIMDAPEAIAAERCGPGSVKLTVSGGGKYSRYRWYDASGHLIIGEINNEYTTPYLYSTSKYSVALVGANGCESVRREVNAIIKEGPSIGASNDFVCKGESVALYGAGGNLYMWSENNMIISNRANIYVNPFVTTTYVLTDPTIAGECRSASFTVRVNKNTDCGALEIDESASVSSDVVEMPEFKVYPNPFTDEFKILSSYEFELLRILDYTGKELYHFPIGTIDPSSIKPDLLPGHYILEIKGRLTVYREKLIKL